MAATLSAVTKPTARVLALLEILQSGGSWTVRDLAERLDVDERTVRRYITHLTDLDVPVRSQRGRYGGYRLAPGFRLPPLMFTDEEAMAVLFALVTARRTAPHLERSRPRRPIVRWRNGAGYCRSPWVGGSTHYWERPSSPHPCRVHPLVPGSTAPLHGLCWCSPRPPERVYRWRWTTPTGRVDAPSGS